MDCPMVRCKGKLYYKKDLDKQSFERGPTHKHYICDKCGATLMYLKDVKK